MLRFHLDEMLRDEAIPSINVFFENIFRYASQQKSLTQLSDITGLKTVGQVTMDCILGELPKLFSGALKKGRHYLTYNFEN